ncbi:hypothetical protein VTL71DRAFT_123 [Oculimacula yallundae]|uniref:Uncharacterized protein n=1 Tax=Oculimacula yallundae TaxID=86028 RepID=A0ABR4D1F1_9HELO
MAKPKPSRSAMHDQLERELLRCEALYKDSPDNPTTFRNFAISRARMEKFNAEQEKLHSTQLATYERLKSELIRCEALSKTFPSDFEAFRNLLLARDHMTSPVSNASVLDVATNKKPEQNESQLGQSDGKLADGKMKEEIKELMRDDRSSDAEVELPGDYSGDPWDGTLPDYIKLAK